VGQLQGFNFRLFFFTRVEFFPELHPGIIKANKIVMAIYFESFCIVYWLL